MENKAITIIGGVNTDIIIKSEKIPQPGDTMIGGDYIITGGGKGANKAIAISKLGGQVNFIARIGNDPFGKKRIEELKRYNISTDYIIIDEENFSGLGIINVDKNGKNMITVSPGSNDKLNPSDIEKYRNVIANSKILIIQLEVRLDAIETALRIAKQNNVMVILDPTPYQRFDEKLLSMVDIIIPNQIEAYKITGKPAHHIETATKAGMILLEKGVKYAIITMGSLGALLVSDQEIKLIRAYKVEVVDSTGASSAFAGALAFCLANNYNIIPAIEFANAAAALTVTKLGAQTSLPTFEEVINFQKSMPIDFEERKLVTSTKEVKELMELSQQIRIDILKMLAEAGSGHPGGSLSIVEILVVLYKKIMVYNAKNPEWQNRDRLILSKGHGAPALYAIHAECGFFNKKELMTLRKYNSILQGHPDMNKTPGIDMSTGSLGQGLSVANGIAIAGKLTNKSYRVYCILGDGEIEEGQIWEAAMTSMHYQLDNICAILDYNGLQIGGSLTQVKAPIEPLVDKWISFGWYVISVDGHDIAELINAFEEAKQIKGKPTIIIAHTIKGKGISFMERIVDYHGAILTSEDCKIALEELEELKAKTNNVAK